MPLPRGKVAKSLEVQLLNYVSDSRNSMGNFGVYHLENSLVYIQGKRFEQMLLYLIDICQGKEKLYDMTLVFW